MPSTALTTTFVTESSKPRPIFRYPSTFADHLLRDVENFPDNAARWTGDKIQRVEDIPQDIDRRWDNAKQDVEDIPDDVAGWAGRKVGDVERFGDDVDRYGDRIDNDYDQGRNDARYDDDNNY
jgi:hypothetical protein